MTYDEFINKVQQEANLPDRETAVAVTEATLTTLGERLYRTDLDQLGAQLPKELSALFFQRQAPENTRQETNRFSLEEFYNRVSARAGVSAQEAPRQLQVVMSVLDQALSPGQLDRIRATLPSEYGRLFT